MAKLAKKLYTLVAHNGLDGYAMHSSVTTEAQRDKILDEKGVILDSYKKADDAEYLANYAQTDEEIKGSSGSFSKKAHGGDKIFIPSVEFKELLKAKSLTE